MHLPPKYAITDERINVTAVKDKATTFQLQWNLHLLPPIMNFSLKKIKKQQKFIFSTVDSKILRDNFFMRRTAMQLGEKESYVYFELWWPIYLNSQTRTAGRPLFLYIYLAKCCKVFILPRLEFALQKSFS